MLTCFVRTWSMLRSTRCLDVVLFAAWGLPLHYKQLCTLVVLINFGVLDLIFLCLQDMLCPENHGHHVTHVNQLGLCRVEVEYTNPFPMVILLPLCGSSCLVVLQAMRGGICLKGHQKIFSWLLNLEKNKEYQYFSGVCQRLIVAGWFYIYYAISSFGAFSAAPREGQFTSARKVFEYLNKFPKGDTMWTLNHRRVVLCIIILTRKLILETSVHTSAKMCSEEKYVSTEKYQARYLFLS